MKVWYQFPEDPLLDAELMFGEDFLRRSPGRETIIRTPTSEDRFPIGDDIICDVCNAGVELFEPLAVSLNRLYCWTCFKEWIQPYLRKKGVTG